MTARLAVDHAGRPADYPTFAREARARAYDLELRYVCRPTTRPINETKIARPSEITAALNAGLEVALIWQDGKDTPDTMRGADGGIADGREAARQAAALGQPGRCVIFVAVDFDAREPQFPTIAAYLNAFRKEIGDWPLGVYGSARIIDRFVGYGPAKFGMQTTAWSAGQVSVHAHLLQRLDRDRVLIAGVTCDHDEVLRPIPTWRRQEASMPELRIISRAEWGARPPKRRLAMTIPTPRLWLHHLAAEWHGAAGMRTAQLFHQNTRGWDDFAYSFAVDDDGTIFEGRGAGVVGAHTIGDNSTSHAIVAMGDFSKRPPSSQMLAAVADLVAHGNRQGWWDGITGGHRDAPGNQTACPGDHLERRINDLRSMVAQRLARPAPAPQPAPQEDDDMRPIAGIYSWAKRRDNGAFPRFIATQEYVGCTVASVNHATFGGPAGPHTPGKHHGVEDYIEGGLWRRRFFGTGAPLEFAEADGSFFLICENGTYDVAAKPAA
jgi:hypothetical protein